MAKHVAYPCVFAFIFCNFAAKSAESLKENEAIFTNITSFDLQMQPLSLLTDESFTSIESYLIGQSLRENSWEEETSAQEKMSASERAGQIPAPLTPTSARILHHAKWVEALESTAPQTHAEHTAVFLDSLVPGAYHSPIKDGTNTHYLLKGISPKGTPRRKENLIKLRKGQAPLLVNLKTGQRIPYEMHHVGQKKRKSLIVMLPVELHKDKAKLFHTYTGPSDIDRNEFNSEKRRVFKEQGRKFEKLKKGN